MAAALEWADYKASLCPGGCGYPKVESMDVANESRYDAVAVRCFACEARDKAGKKWATDENSDTAGLLFSVVEDADASGRGD